MKIARNVGAVMAVLAICSLFQESVFAAVPRLINYQGRLTDTQGVPMTGAYDVTFRIYDAQTAGHLIWQETHSGVIAEKGLFSVILGSVSSLNMAFDKPYYLEIKVGSEVLSPRQLMTSSGYAIRAEMADSVPGLDPGLIGTKSVSETNIGDGKVPVFRTSNGKLNYESIIPSFSAGSALLSYSDTETQTQSSSYRKVKEILVGAGGTITVDFDLKGGRGHARDMVYARIYVNDAAVGVIRSRQPNTYQTFSENISVNPGDKVQLYSKGNPGYYAAVVRNFRLKCAHFLGGYVLISKIEDTVPTEAP